MFFSGLGFSCLEFFFKRRYDDFSEIYLEAHGEWRENGVKIYTYESYLIDLYCKMDFEKYPKDTQVLFISLKKYPAKRPLKNIILKQNLNTDMQLRVQCPEHQWRCGQIQPNTSGLGFQR